MSLFFLSQHIHFILEILGALTFATMAWLALDSFLIRKDFTTASRGIGFGLLALFQTVHAFDTPLSTETFLEYGLYITGLIFVIWNLALEAPVKRPQFNGLIATPVATAFVLPFDIVITFGLFLISFLAYNQYKKESKKILLLFWIGFLLLALGSLTSLFYISGVFSFLWIIDHLFQLTGFLALGWWVWSYMRERLKEQILLIFISSTLLMAVVVSLTFTSVLTNRIEVETQSNLLSNVRTLTFSVESLQEEALIKSSLIALDEDLVSAFGAKDIDEIDRLAKKLSKEKDLDFLTVIDSTGEVILRAYATSQKGENLSGEYTVETALVGKPSVTITRGSYEGFSIQASSPVRSGNTILGVVETGFLLDNIFVDKMKKTTGLDMSIFENDTRIATTLFNHDGRTRSVGIKLTDPKVLKKVLGEGNGVTLSTTFLSRPVIASYLPLTNTEGDVVGMLSATRSQAEIFKTAQSTNKLVLIVVIIIMLVLIAPIYNITRRLTEGVC